MKVSVSRTINCAHHLPGTDLHGHTYRLTAIASLPVRDQGYALRFEELKTALDVICNAYDHKRLEVVGVQPATAEMLAEGTARALSKSLQRIVNVRVDVGDSGSVETEMIESEGDYFDRFRR